MANLALASSANPSLLNQPVTFIATVSAPSAGSTAPTGNVTFVDQTTGSALAVVAISAGKASWTGSGLAVNAHTIAAIYSGDPNYITSAATLVQQVQYHFSGFLSPLSTNLAFGLNRTIPVKFQLTDFNGVSISSLAAIQSLQVLDATGTNVLANTGSAALRYDSTANQFIANWSTKGLPAGTYTVTLVLADGTTYTKQIQLSANGSNSALLVDGSGSATTAVGALLGGDIDLYVDNSNGDLTANELARIQDAVTAVDAVTVPYGVTITEVSDPTLADVTLNMDTTSLVGGYADGVLGCTTDAGQITIISGWNYYAGSDPTRIGSAQYDFETVVTHELGHALGLGHSANAASVMYATLTTGITNRAMAVADLNVPDSDTGACGLHTASSPGARVEFYPAGISREASSTITGYQEQGDLLSIKQAALNAVLADWSSTTDFAGHVARILDEKPAKGPSHRVGLPTHYDHRISGSASAEHRRWIRSSVYPETWSSIEVSSGSDRIIGALRQDSNSDDWNPEP